MKNGSGGKGKGFARRVTSSNFDSLKPLLRPPRDPGTTGSGGTGRQDSKPEPPELASARALFKGDPIKVPNWFTGTPTGVGSVSTASRGTTAAQAGNQAVGPIVVTSNPVWTKKLSKTDAQRQKGHPTGDLRLMKARHPIDQTTYFRHQVFGKLRWTTQDDGHEEATGSFDVVILGKHYGIHDLTLSHRPMGHANQENYTTGLRWGSSLAGLLRHHVEVSERELRLYILPSSSPADFAIRII